MPVVESVFGSPPLAGSQPPPVSSERKIPWPVAAKRELPEAPPVTRRAWRAVDGRRGCACGSPTPSAWPTARRRAVPVATAPEWEARATRSPRFGLSARAVRLLQVSPPSNER